MRKAKIASVGCGWVARRWHLPTIAELRKRGDLDYVAVCDADADTAREVGEEYGLPYYTDVEICIALYESSRSGMMAVTLPITETTVYEQMIHDEFHPKFGHSIDE